MLFLARYNLSFRSKNTSRSITSGATGDSRMWLSCAANGMYENLEYIGKGFT